MAIKTKIEEMVIGDKIISKYVASSGAVGTFSEVGSSTATLIAAASTATPNGAFYFIYVGNDFKGRRILIADRNVQHSISWDTLNSAMVASGEGRPTKFTGYADTDWLFHVRLLTGGTSSTTASSSEWDKYIVNGTGGGQYTAGDNAVWNWGGIYSWTSTTWDSGGGRTLRGSGTVSGKTASVPNTTQTNIGFRPVLVAESLKAPIQNKYLFQDGGEIKKYGTSKVMVEKSAITAMTGNSAPSPFVVGYSGQVAGNEAWKAFDKANTLWSTPSTSGWISYKFDRARTIVKYSLKSAGGIADIKDYTIEGSNDNTVWTALDTYSIPNSAYQTLTRSIPSPVSFLYYRLKFTSNFGHTQSSVNEIDFLELVEQDSPLSWQTIGTAPATKALFDTDGMTDLTIITNEAIQGLVSDVPELLCWTDETSPFRTANLTAIPNPQLLLPVGDIEVGEVESVKVDALQHSEYTTDVTPPMASNSTPSPYVVSASSFLQAGLEAYRAFANDSNTSRWQPNGQTGWISFSFGSTEKKVISKYAIVGQGTSSPKNWTLEGSNDAGATWKVLNTVANQTGWGAPEKREFTINNKEAFSVYRLNVTANNAATYLAINEIELFESSIGNTDIKLLVSSDSGTTWKGKSSASISDLTSVKANSWSPAEFNALTSSELASLFPNGKARFAFYLEQEKSTDIVEVQSLKLNEKQYTLTPSLDSASVVYEMLQAEKPKVFVTRDDGTTWVEVQADNLIDLSKLPPGDKLRVKFQLKEGQEIHGYSYSWI